MKEIKRNCIILKKLTRVIKFKIKSNSFQIKTLLRENGYPQRHYFVENSDHLKLYERKKRKFDDYITK